MRAVLTRQGIEIHDLEGTNVSFIQKRRRTGRHLDFIERVQVNPCYVAIEEIGVESIAFVEDGATMTGAQASMLAVVAYGIDLALEAIDAHNA